MDSVNIKFSKIKSEKLDSNKMKAIISTGYPIIGRLYLGLTKPRNPIPGTSFSGVVEKIGRDVTDFEIGDMVFGESLDTFGTHAEYVSIKEDGIITHIPENISFEEVGGVGDGLMTSWNFLNFK